MIGSLLDFETLPSIRPEVPERSASRKEKTGLYLRFARRLTRELLENTLRPAAEHELLVEGKERFSGRPLSLLYRGDGFNLAYVQQLWFRDSACCTPAAGRSADLLLQEKPLPGAWLPEAQQARSLLWWIRQQSPIPTRKDQLLQGMRRKTRLEAQRQLRRLAVAAQIEEADALIDEFYAELYCPYIEQRFGSAQVRLDPETFRRSCVGMPILTLRDTSGALLAALLLQKRGRLMVAGLTGVRQHQGRDILPGLSEGIDYHCRLAAYLAGCDCLDMGTSRAALSDGVLRYKLRWAAKPVAGRMPRRRYSLTVQRPSTAVVAAIREHGFIGQTGSALRQLRVDDSGRLYWDALQISD